MNGTSRINSERSKYLSASVEFSSFNKFIAFSF